MGSCNCPDCRSRGNEECHAGVEYEELRARAEKAEAKLAQLRMEHEHLALAYSTAKQNAHDCQRAHEALCAQLTDAQRALDEERKKYGELERQHIEDLTALMWHVHQDDTKRKMSVDEALFAIAEVKRG